MARYALHVAADADAFALLVPPLVVGPCDQVGSDAGALGIVLDEIGDLCVQTVGMDLPNVELGLAIYLIAAVVDVRDSFAVIPVIQRLQRVEPFAHRAQVGI